MAFNSDWIGVSEATKAERDAVLVSDFQPTDKSTLQVNVLAVNTGDRLVLIDAGSRGKMQPTAGRLLQNLAAAEIKPEEVDTILITHAHPDHLWGVANASDTERTFPNAEYVIGEAELNFWMQPQHPLESHATWGGTYRQNMKTLATIKDRIRTVKPDGEVVSGITALATPGHTPGHTSVQIASVLTSFSVVQTLLGTALSPSSTPTGAAGSTWISTKARRRAEPSWIDVRVRRS
jgi:glyoxylase-like metal-dependent hydrolase (beta-lactamase superfamily II)